MTAPEQQDTLERYSRQMLLPHIGRVGQAALRSARVAVLGAGGLGSFSASFLVRAGVSLVRIVDRDLVELTNLHRTAHFNEQDVGLPKVEALGRKLTRLNSEVTVETQVADVNAWSVLQLIDDVDLVVDGFDNMEARYVLNDAAVSLATPWVYAGTIGSDATVMSIIPGEGPCLRCVLPEIPPPGALPTCETAGVLPIAPAFTASFQVKEAINVILGRGRPGRLYSFDLEGDRFQTADIGASASCPTCARRDFEFLKQDAGTRAVSLCGRNAVHIHPRNPADLDLERLAKDLSATYKTSYNGFYLSVDSDGLETIVFKDARAMIKGTRDVEKAKSIYSRLVGL